jgi:hypothetical protein
MAIADHQCDAGSFCGDVGILFGRDRLGGIERPLVQRRMAPIASDTRPTRAAATVIERREIRSCLKSIVSIPNR